MKNEKPKLYFMCEAIVNYPTLKEDERIKNGSKISDMKFTAILHFDKIAYENSISTVLKDAEKLNSDAIFSYKNYDNYIKMKENEIQFNPSLKSKNEKAINRIKSFKDILGNNYVGYQSVKAWESMVICENLYKEHIKLQSISSGDRVFVKGSFVETTYEGNTHWSGWLNLIVLVEKNVYSLASMSRDDSDFYSALTEKYKTIMKKEEVEDLPL
jgi:hypothetical protein